MKNLTADQKEIAKKQVNVNSLDQYYFIIWSNKAEHESEVIPYYDLNKSCDNGEIVPFVPAYDLD